MVLETDAIVLLRHPSERDREEFLHLRAESAAYFRPWQKEIPHDVDDLYGPATFDEYIESIRDRRMQHLLLCSVEDGRILGTFKLRNITHGNELYAVISMWVGVQYAGNGYMSKGLRLVLRHAFLRLNLHRIEANVLPTNLSSTRLLQRVGFRKEGIAARFARIDGEWKDLDRHVLLAEDWEKD